MILPSDGDAPHEHDDDVPGDDEEDLPSSADFPDDDGAEDDDDDIPAFLKDLQELNEKWGMASPPGEGMDDEEEAFDGEDEDPAPPHHPFNVPKAAGPGWRRDLKRELAACIDDLKEIEDPDEEFDPPEPPDLYAFFSELSALRNEVRRSGRKATEAINQYAAAIGATGPPATAPAPWPVEMCLSILALYDLAAEGSPAADVALAPLASAAGLTRIPTIGRPLDPAVMTVTAVEVAPGQTPNTVIRESEAGFLRAGTVLRPARVVVAG